MAWPLPPCLPYDARGTLPVTQTISWGLSCSWWPSVVDGGGIRHESRFSSLFISCQHWAPGVHGKEVHGTLQKSGQRSVQPYFPYWWLHELRQTLTLVGLSFLCCTMGKLKTATGLCNRLSWSLGTDVCAKTAAWFLLQNEVKHSASKWTSVSVDTDGCSWEQAAHTKEPWASSESSFDTEGHCLDLLEGRTPVCIVLESS